MTVVDSGSTSPLRSPRRDLPPSMVERMTLIIDAFDGPASRLTLEDVAGRTQLPRSTVHRILDQLVRLNWVDHDSLGYSLGRRAIGLGGGDGGRAQIREAAAPLLHDLHMQTGMVVHLSVLDGSESIYLDKIGGRIAAGLPSRVGGRAPAYATAGGRAMLAWIDPETIDAMYPHRLNRSTGRTVTDLPTLHQELNRIRQASGLAFEHGESMLDVSWVGVAVRSTEGPVAAVSLCGDSRTSQLKRVAPLVVRAAREVSRILYPDAESPRRSRKTVAAPEKTWSSDVLDRLLAVESGQWL